MRVIILSELQNVAPRFRRAIWRKREVNRIFASAKEAGKYYNLRNCNYDFEDEDGNIVKSVRNARLDGYGNRI